MSEKYLKEIAKELKMIRREMQKMNKNQEFTINAVEASKIIDDMLGRTIGRNSRD